MLSTALALLLTQTCPGDGTGVDGPLDVQSSTARINEAFALAQSAAAGSTTVTLEASAVPAKFPAGTLVLLHQTQAATPSGIGAASPFNTGVVGVGHAVFAKVASATGATLTLVEPLSQSFAAPGAQLVIVPQYTTVTIRDAGAILAPAWNGTSGGLLVLVASGAVVLDGQLTAQGLGFRGGAAAHGTAGPLDGGPCLPGAFAGESINLGAFVRSTQNVWSGGGGATCWDNGGGGGGSIGIGGTGGLNDDSANASLPVTRGGASATRSIAQLVFGGGGGGAFGDVTAQEATPGGNGGGVVIVRAGSLSGSGRVVVDGQRAADSFSNGSGGGGAAGTILLEIGGTLSCGGLQARGGGGGNAIYGHGVGAGGAGGRIGVRAGALAACPRDVTTGIAGVNPNGQRIRGTPISPTDQVSIGDEVIETGAGGGCFLLPPNLSIRRPIADEVMVGPTFCFDGAASGAKVSGSVDGKALTAVDVLPTQQWQLCTSDLPSGPHALVVQTFDSNGAKVAEASVQFRSRGQPLVAGCSCSTESGSAGVFALIAGLLGAVRQRRRQVL